MSNHKFYNEIVAWASGEEIEWRAHGTDIWRPLDSDHATFIDCYEFRIPPKQAEFFYKRYIKRNAEDTGYLIKIVNYRELTDTLCPCKLSDFVQWIDHDWQTLNVELK